LTGLHELNSGAIGSLTLRIIIASIPDISALESFGAGFLRSLIRKTGANAAVASQKPDGVSGQRLTRQVLPHPFFSGLDLFWGPMFISFAL